MEHCLITFKTLAFFCFICTFLCCIIIIITETHPDQGWTLSLKYPQSETFVKEESEEVSRMNVFNLSGFTATEAVNRKSSGTKRETLLWIETEDLWGSFLSSIKAERCFCCVIMGSVGRLLMT